MGCITLSYILYGCETRSLTLREECRLRVSDNRVLRKIFGPKRDEEPGEWRKLHKEELNDPYCSPNIIRVINSRIMRRPEHVARILERRGVCSVLVGKPEGKSHLGDTGVDGSIILRWISGSGIGELYAVFWWGNLRERYHFEDTGVDGRIILKWISGSGMG